MTKETKLGGTYTLSDPTMSVYRMGYGAMRVTVIKEPREREAAAKIHPFRHFGTSSNVSHL